ncbi:kynureninase [Lentzea aerocolonigenes]|uniref:kynureninase n=1 Tax=Lentzea aerocolonigenes TaxID=68170 RepID=UPI000A890CA8|nr:kynureninase [Lentzea aerocolonigenes]MCP2242292.1 Kynureninase [Lentzea aerocolonigenes]
MTVYRGYQQHELDLQYSPSSLVADFGAVIDAYRDDSAAARALLPHDRRNLRYGTEPGQTLDIFSPSDEPGPAVFFVHGGYWQQLSKDDSTFPAPGLLEAGLRYVTPDYPLAPHARLDTIVESVREAFSWLWHNASSHGIDRERIVVAGSSAGAHLVATLLATDWTTRGLPRDPIAGAVLLGGVFDLRPIRLTYVNDVMGLNEIDVVRLSPQLNSAAVHCPVVVAWGEHETAEFKRQSSEFAQHLRSRGIPVTSFEQAGRNHFDSPYDLGERDSRLFTEVLRLVDGTAETLDRADRLARHRAWFSLPEDSVYLVGNSLGPLQKNSWQRVSQVLGEEWGRGLVGSWNSAGWFDKPRTVGEQIAPLIGAAPGQVIAADNTSINLYKALVAALALRPGRSVVVAEAGAFPTDLYVIEGALESFLGHSTRLIESGGLEAALDDDVAVVVLSHVDYRTSALHDLAEVTRTVHRSGALVIWDLCHSAGALPIHLDESEADFAVGCTYKYLNGGPGSPAFNYVARRHQEAARQPLSGWHGHRSPFEFAIEYVPADGINRFRTGTPPILSYAPLEASLELWREVDLTEVRAKSLALSDMLINAVEAELGLEVLTPRNPAHRGSHVALRHDHAYGVVRALIDRGVVCDFRAPDVIRVGLAPLYTRFADVQKAVEALKTVLAQEEWARPAYQQRLAVT